jgi:hypothetical protein
MRIHPTHARNGSVTIPGMDGQRQKPLSQFPAQASPPPAFSLRRPVLFANQYCWFVLLSALDIMLTHTILFKFKELGYYAAELNTFADWVIRQFGLWGAIVLKCASIVTVVLIVEIIGRRRFETARTLIWCVVAMATVPVFVALVQMAAVAFRP